MFCYCHTTLFEFTTALIAIDLGLHTTTLILAKGALDARGSKLMPDKKDFGYILIYYFGDL